jgi:hypothetical protein
MNGFGRRGGVALVAATLMFATFGAMTGAGAATRHPLGTAGLQGRIASAAPSAGKVPTTNYGAGYFTYPAEYDGIASVGATFTVPTISCQKSGDREWLLPGIWVFDASRNLTEQVDVNLNCNQGSLYQQSAICIQGSCDSSLTVTPGDVIEASLVYTATDTVGTIRDRTQSTSAQVVGDPITTDYTVFVGDLGPGVFPTGTLRVPTFTSVPFSSVQVNGQYLSDWPPVPYSLKTAAAVQIKTGAISHNQNFTTTFQHN